MPVTYAGSHLGFESCQLVLSHGISPSVASITSNQPPGNLPPVGDLILSDDFTSITVRDMAVNYMSVSIGGGYTWTYQLHDRRWKWKFGEVTGWYNRRLPNGDLDEDHQKTPRELANILLKAMNEEEESWSTVGLPVEPRPEVKWDRSNPAGELQALCTPFNVRVILSTDNKVNLVQRGFGRQLPQKDAESFNPKIEGKPSPDRIKVYSGPRAIQRRVELEAVGYDWKNKKIVLIADLPYSPNNLRGIPQGGTGGWTIPVRPSRVLPYDNTVDPHDEEAKERRENVKWADETVYRWYRIRKKDKDGKDIKLDDKPIKDYTFRGILLETEEADEGVKTNLTARIYGTYNSLTIRDSTRVGQDVTGRYEGSVSFDAKTNVFKFGDNIYLMNIEAHEKFEQEILLAEPAIIYAELTANWNPDGLPDRHHVEHWISGNPYQPKPVSKIVIVDEVIPTSIQKYKIGGLNELMEPPLDKPIDNTEDVEDELAHWLGREMSALQATRGDQAKYIGIQVIEPDGLIEQVTFTINDGGASTTASTASEHMIYDMSYQEKLRIVDARREVEKTRRARAWDRHVALAGSDRIVQY